MDQTTLLLARCIGVVAGGLFSWSMINLVVSGRIRFYLADQKFSLLVLIGGVLLAIMVLLKIRALAMATGHEHGHDHGHHHHDHDHSHDHGVSLWRYMVLAVPLMIILMDLAPRGLSANIYAKRMSKAQIEAIAAVGNATLPEGRSPDGSIKPEQLKALQDAASIPSKRDFWESVQDPVRVETVGQVVKDRSGSSTNRYRLMRIKITCCAADATPVGVIVMGAVEPAWKEGEWLKVVGPVSFFKTTNSRTGAEQFFTVIHQQQAERIPAPPDLYVQ